MCVGGGGGGEGAYKMQSVPPLPRKHVTKTIPFSHTGVYYWLSLPNQSQDHKKIGVFIYMLSDKRGAFGTNRRYVYGTLLMGLRRLIACLGSPYEITSDNAGQFKLASGTIDKL